MNITYEVESYEIGDKTVNVTFTDENGLIYTRSINIPYNSDGTIDEDYFSEICEGQLSGVENKLKVGVIQFKDPVEAHVGVGTTSI